MKGRYITMKSTYKPLPNFVHDDTVYFNGNTVNYTCINYDNGITQYIFDKPLSEEEQQSVIDYITLFPFLV